MFLFLVVSQHNVCGILQWEMGNQTFLSGSGQRFWPILGVKNNTLCGTKKTYSTDFYSPKNNRLNSRMVDNFVCLSIVWDCGYICCSEDCYSEGSQGQRSACGGTSCLTP